MTPPTVSPRIASRIQGAFISSIRVACAMSLFLAITLANETRAQAPTGDVAAAIRRVDCESLVNTVKTQAWNAGGAPFGKSYSTWTNADFDAVNKYAGECTRILQQRNVPQAGLAFVEIYSFLQPLQNALARAGQQRAEDARVAEWREKNRKWSEQKQAEASQHKAHVQQLRNEGERLANERAVDQFKMLGIGPDLIERTIIVRDYMGKPRHFMSFYQYMGYVFANAKLEKMQARRWDLNGATGNGFELITKLPGRQTFGLLFTLDGSEIYPTHLVQGDNPIAFTFADLNTMFTLLETTAGLNTGDLQYFLVD